MPGSTDQNSALANLTAALTNRPVSVAALVAALAAGPISYTAYVQQQASPSASVNGIRKGAGVGSADTAAVPGTDYVLPFGPGDSITTFSRKLSVIFSDAANVKNYGAIGGGNDDSAALAAAATAVCSKMQQTYWSVVGVPTLYLPSDNYTTAGLDVPCPMNIQGGGPNGTHLTLKAGANRSVIRVLPEPQSDPAQQGPRYLTKIADISIDGNKGSQSSSACNGLCDGIEFQDAPYDINTRYGSSGRVENVNVTGAVNNGLYVGKNRNLGFLTGSIITYSSGQNVYFNSSVDWQINQSSIGAATGDGILCYFCGAITIATSAIYNNNRGIEIADGFGSYFLVTGSTIGANNYEAVRVAPSSLSVPGVVGMSNNHIVDNSLASNGGAAQLYFRNVSHVSVDGAQFFFSGGSGQANAKYLIDNDPSTYVSVNNLMYGNVPGTTPGSAPYTVAAFSNPTHVVGPIDNTSGNFTLSVPLATPQVNTPAILSPSAVVNLGTSHGLQAQVGDQGSGTSANFARLLGGIAGQGISYGAQGSDANINVAVQPKGTGSVILGASGGVVSTLAPLQLPSFTVAGLPTCTATLNPSIVRVYDALNPTYNGALTGGGTGASANVIALCASTSGGGFAWTSH